MKFRAHETFFIRKGWLSKGMKYVINDSDVFISKKDNPMDVLGIGANMVKSLRYWLQAVGLTEEPRSGKRIQTLTAFGNSVFYNDRYVEELGTLYLLQYKLASNYSEATSWYYFFNEFTMSEFSRDDFVSFVQNQLKMKGTENVALRSLNDDFSCIVNTYLPRYKNNPEKIDPENNIDCPFGELGLLDNANKVKKTYKKVIPLSVSIDPWVALAVISDRANGKKEISLNELLTGDCNIGKVFNLDAVTMLDVLYRIERLHEIKIIRTAGLDVIHILNKPTFQSCVNEFYKSLSSEGTN